jgi:hypothetical protein
VNPLFVMAVMPGIWFALPCTLQKETPMHWFGNAGLNVTDGEPLEKELITPY